MSFAELAAQLAEIGRQCYARGWALGTSGNFSAVVSRDPLHQQRRRPGLPAALHGSHVHSASVRVELTKVGAVLLDIEGTTTPIEFVHQTLFGYARARMSEFLQRHSNDPEVRPTSRDSRPSTPPNHANLPHPHGAMTPLRSPPSRTG